MFQQVVQNKCNPQFKNLPNFADCQNFATLQRIRSPWKRPNFGLANNVRAVFFFLFPSLPLQILATICQQMVNKSTEFSRRSLLVCFDHELLDVHVGEKRTGQENLKHSAHLEMFFFFQELLECQNLPIFGI